jgi:hypothetical protein
LSDSLGEDAALAEDAALIEDAAVVGDAALTSDSLAGFPVSREVVLMKSLVPDETMPRFWPLLF